MLYAAKCKISILSSGHHSCSTPRTHIRFFKSFLLLGCSLITAGTVSFFLSKRILPIMPQLTYTDWAKRTWKTYINFVSPPAASQNVRKADRTRGSPMALPEKRRDDGSRNVQHPRLEDHDGFSKRLSADCDFPMSHRRKVQFNRPRKVSLSIVSTNHNQYDPDFDSFYVTPYDSEHKSSKTLCNRRTQSRKQSHPPPTERVRFLLPNGQIMSLINARELQSNRDPVGNTQQ